MQRVYAYHEEPAYGWDDGLTGLCIPEGNEIKNNNNSKRRNKKEVGEVEGS